MGFMNDRVEMRLAPETKKTIEKIVRDQPEKYYNQSHFIRVALIREIRRAENGKD